jgi:hypothetical protein
MPNPVRDALAELARKFDEIAAGTDEWAPASVGYKLAMQHAAERAWSAADEHNEPEDPEAWWQQHLAAAAKCPDCQGTGIVHVETDCGGCSGYPGIKHEPACGVEPCPRGCEVPTTSHRREV